LCCADRLRAPSRAAPASELYPLSLHAALPISALHHVEGHQHARMPQVTVVVHGHAAHVHAHLAGPGRLEWFFRTRQRIVDMQHRSEEHTSELQSRENLVCRLLLEKKKTAPHST